MERLAGLAVTRDGAARRRRLLTAMAAVGAAGSNPLAAIAAASAPTTGSEWLKRIRDAATDRSYLGTATFSTGGAVSSSRLAHFCDGDQRFEKVEGLDGKLRLQYRHNDRLVTLWPASRVAVVEQYVGVPDFPALPADALRADGHYAMQSIGVKRACGFDADVLRFEPRDEHRFGQTLWAERRSGLLLRAETFGPKGEVLETSAFIELAFARRPDVQSILKPMRRLDGWRIVRPKVVKTRIEAEGWQLVRPVPGFDLVACHRRPLDTSDAIDVESAVQVVQAVYSDGLAQVSVFVEPYDAVRHRSGHSMIGATHTSMSRRDDKWLTVVGEVPLSTVQAFESALERRH